MGINDLYDDDDFHLLRSIADHKLVTICNPTTGDILGYALPTTINYYMSSPAEFPEDILSARLPAEQ